MALAVLRGLVAWRDLESRQHEVVWRYLGPATDVSKDTLTGRVWHRIQRSAFPTFSGLALVTLITLLARMASGANGDLRSDAICCAFAVLLCGARIFLKWNSMEVEPTRRANCCCSCCFCILVLTLLGQILGSWIYLAATVAPSFTEGYPSVAYWCQGEPQGILVVLEPGYLSTSATLVHVQRIMSSHARVCIYDPLGSGFSA